MPKNDRPPEAGEHKPADQKQPDRPIRIDDLVPVCQHCKQEVPATRAGVARSLFVGREHLIPVELDGVELPRCTACGTQLGHKGPGR